MSRDREDWTVFTVVGVLAAIPVIVALNALAVVKLWGWFIVPMGAPYIVWQQAIGLSTLVGVLTYRYRKDDGAKDMAAKVSAALMSPLVALALGWLLSGYAGK